MRPSFKLVSAFLPSALLLAYASGCGSAFTSAPGGGDDAGPDTGCNCGSGDTGGNDGNAPNTDSGKPDVDSGAPDPDSGKPDVDSGSPPDSGCGGCDSGTPDTGTDSGTDTGTDSGMMTDSGTDSGMMTDSGTDSGMTDSGGGDASDGGTDAADAGPCVDLTTTCAGNQPLICQAGSWVTNGGLCGYGCSAGACQCNDPYSVDGGTGRFKPVFGGGLEDMSTGLTWYTTAAIADKQQGYSAAVTDCTTLGARVPHESELIAVIAQQATNVFCSPQDMDSQFFSLFSLENSWYWTDTPPLGFPTHEDVVNVSDGKVEDGDNVLSPPLPMLIPNTAFTICVSP